MKIDSLQSPVVAVMISIVDEDQTVQIDLPKFLM
jgi:hypothetical protein